jgi:hypothetical protein
MVPEAFAAAWKRRLEHTIENIVEQIRVSIPNF